MLCRHTFSNPITAWTHTCGYGLLTSNDFACPHQYTRIQTVSIAVMIDFEHGFCLWGTATCTTLSSRCLRGHSRILSAVLPASPSPHPAGTLLLLACSTEEQRRDTPTCPRKSEAGRAWLFFLYPDTHAPGGNMLRVGPNRISSQLPVSDLSE